MQGRQIGSWWHLARRFLEVGTARRLTEPERKMLSTWLDSAEEASLFYRQAVADQRHAFRAAQRLHHFAPDRRDLIRAALFHDVGKWHAGLGIVGRSVAGALTKLGLPLRGRFAIYVAHGVRGAEELQAIGCEEVVVEFARHHHDGRPESVDSEDWSLLEQADLPGKPPETNPPAIR